MSSSSWWVLSLFRLSHIVRIKFCDLNLSFSRLLPLPLAEFSARSWSLTTLILSASRVAELKLVNASWRLTTAMHADTLNWYSVYDREKIKEDLKKVCLIWDRSFLIWYSAHSALNKKISLTKSSSYTLLFYLESARNVPVPFFPLVFFCLRFFCLLRSALPIGTNCPMHSHIEAALKVLGPREKTCCWGLSPIPTDLSRPIPFLRNRRETSITYCFLGCVTFSVTHSLRRLRVP